MDGRDLKETRIFGRASSKLTYVSLHGLILISLIACTCSQNLIHTCELREYPIGFGVRFAATMKHFKKERSHLTNPSYVSCFAVSYI